MLSTTTQPWALKLMLRALCNQHTRHPWYYWQHWKSRKTCLLLTEVTSQSMNPPPKVRSLDGSRSLFPVIWLDVLLSTTTLPWVLIQLMLHNQYSGHPQLYTYDVQNQQTPCLLLAEVTSQNMDPEPKLYALDQSMQVHIPRVWLHAVFNYHTALGPYTTCVTLLAGWASQIVPMSINSKICPVYYWMKSG